MFNHWSSNTIPFNFLHPNDLLFWTLCLTWLLLALAVLGEGTWSSHSPSFSSHFMVSGGAWGKGLECPKSNDTQLKSSYFSDTYILFLLCATWTRDLLRHSVPYLFQNWYNLIASCMARSGIGQWLTWVCRISYGMCLLHQPNAICYLQGIISCRM